MPSWSKFESVTKHPIHAIHRLDHRGMLIVAIDIASVDDR